MIALCIYRYLHSFKMSQKAAALKPWHFYGWVYDVVTFLCTYRDLGNIVKSDFSSKFLVVFNDLNKYILAEIDHIHLIHSNYYLRQAHQGNQEGVTDGLLNYAFTCVDQDDGQIRVGSTGNHVTGILDMAGSIGYDELTFFSLEILIGNVYSNTLFALGFQAVGQD